MILILSQRDIRHPNAGGAEKYTHYALNQLAKKHQVVHISVAYPGLIKEEVIDGIHYIRKGTNLINLIWYAYRYYVSHKSEIKLVIDHCNTHQFFTFLYARKKRVFFIHQLTQEIWIYFYGPIIGRFLRVSEEILLRLSRGICITVSQSTQKDLLSRGFDRVYISPEGNKPRYTVLPPNNKKDYLVYSGRIVPYKRVEDAILLSAAVKKKLIIIGAGKKSYVNRLKDFAIKHKAECQFLGYISIEEKNKFIEEAYLHIMPSIREGWGLVITEAANLGTPSLVYDAPGTKEAVDHGNAGFIANRIGHEGMINTYHTITREHYDHIREQAFQFSLTLSWERTSSVFSSIIIKEINEIEHSES